MRSPSFRHWRRWLGGLLLGLVLWYSLRPTEPPPSAAPPPAYAAERAAKDSAWRFGPDSPLPDSVRARFRGLRYFAPAAVWRVAARLESAASADALLVPVRNGSAPEPYVRAGRLTFTLAGQACALTALRRPAEPPTAPLFVPFTDGTTGRETYEGGRYLDVPPPAEGQSTVWLDFNQAYAPNCAHAPSWQCPMPPPENALPVAVRAGERQ